MNSQQGFWICYEPIKRMINFFESYCKWTCYEAKKTKNTDRY
jgi:hypothetical protein